MRILTCTLLIALLSFTSCRFYFRKFKEPFKAETANDPRLKQLPGEWMCTKMIIEADNKAAELALESVLSESKEDMELSVMELGANDSAWLSYRAKGHGIVAMNWKFTPVNDISFSEFDKHVAGFTIANLDKDTLELLGTMHAGSDKGKGDVHGVFHFVKIDTRKIGGIRLYDPSINTWRQQPHQSETHLQIVNRLKAMLRYDYVYIRSVYYSGAGVIDTRKFNMPFQYYNGGISLKKYPDGNDTFTDFFYSKENIDEAIAILATGFKKTQYVKRPNYSLEYAEFMKDLAGVIE